MGWLLKIKSVAINYLLLGLKWTERSDGVLTTLYYLMEMHFGHLNGCFME